MVQMLNRNGFKGYFEMVSIVNLKCLLVNLNAFKCKVEVVQNGFNVILKWS